MHKNKLVSYFGVLALRMILIRLQIALIGGWEVVLFLLATSYRERVSSSFNAICSVNVALNKRKATQENNGSANV